MLSLPSPLTLSDPCPDPSPPTTQSSSTSTKQDSTSLLRDPYRVDAQSLVNRRPCTPDGRWLCSNYGARNPPPKDRSSL